MKRLILFLLFIPLGVLYGQVGNIRNLSERNTLSRLNEAIDVVNNHTDTFEVYLDTLEAIRGDVNTKTSGGIMPADTAAMLEPYLLETDTAAMLSPYAETSEVILPADTSDMLSKYLEIDEVILPADTAAMLSPYETDANVALKVNISDTATMLTPYATLVENALKVNISDTASMLLPYATDADNDLKVNISDTAAMILPYATDADVALKVNIADTASMLSPYETDANVALKVNISDTATMLSKYLEIDEAILPADTADMLSKYLELDEAILPADTANMLDPYAPKAAPTFTTSITMGDAGISEAELEILDGATVTTDQLNYVDFTSSGQTQMDAKQDTTDAVNAYTLFNALTDTVVFMSGFIGGEAGDTALFSYNDKVIGKLHDGSYTFNAVKLKVLSEGTTPDVDVGLYKFKDIAGTQTEMTSADLTCDNVTVGDSIMTFTVATVDPFEGVYLLIKECTTQPVRLWVSLSGYWTE